MQKKALARSDLEVSVLGFGCWAIIGGFNWGPQDESDSLAALRAAYDAGVTFFDTAEGYGGGESERLLSKGLSDVRSEIVIATKVSPDNYAADALVAACERSLKNLNSDYIDLYQLHWPNRHVPVTETLGVLEGLKAAGKIRAYGVSNFGPADLADSLSAEYAVCSNQLAYNLLFRAIEFDILPLCHERDVSVLCYSPLMQGLLTGKFRSGDDIPDDRARTRHYPSSRSQARHNEEGAMAETFAALQRIREIAAKAGRPIAELALAWLMAQEGVTSVIVGARNAEQIQSNVRATEVKPSAELIAELGAATEELKNKLGPNADMWESISRIR
jgi:myo-inositol catabolism protein IolS